MRPLVLAAALALLAAACSDSPCQDLGEKLCGCTGTARETCERQVEAQLDELDPTEATEDRCERLLDSCSPPEGADLCEWLLTEGGKIACGVAVAP